MGQKVNPTIFRLGTKKSQWRSQFFGKSKEESALFFYQDFEIRKFLNRVFESNGTIITNCVIKRSNLKLDLFLHFYVTSRVHAKTLESFSKISTLKTFVQGKYLNATNFLSVNNIKNKLVKNFKNDSSEIIYITDIIKKKSNYSLFKQKLVDSLSKFTGVSKISLNLISIQNSIESDIRNDLDLKFRIQELKLYSKEQFFTEALEILILVFKKKNSARLLSKFIAFQLQIMKRHNSFLTFFKRALFIFSKLKNSNIFGVKIVISGRFNGVPRSKSRVIQVGRLPLQSIDSKVNYHSTEAHTPYGTFGIKVWICEK